MVYIWQRSRAKQEELFWTGTTWTSVQDFGKLYSFHQALRIVEQRFFRTTLRPFIQSKNYFDQRDKMKRKGTFNTSKEKGETDV